MVSCGSSFGSNFGSNFGSSFGSSFGFSFDSGFGSSCLSCYLVAILRFLNSKQDADCYLLN